MNQLLPNQEPEFTKNVSNKTVCGYFYAFYLAYLVIAVVALIGLVYMLIASKAPFMMKMTSVIQFVIMFGLAITTALFHYLVCTRALLGNKEESAKMLY